MGWGPESDSVGDWPRGVDSQTVSLHCCGSDRARLGSVCHCEDPATLPLRPPWLRAQQATSTLELGWSDRVPETPGEAPGSEVPPPLRSLCPDSTLATCAPTNPLGTCWPCPGSLARFRA